MYWHLYAEELLGEERVGFERVWCIRSAKSIFEFANAVGKLIDLLVGVLCGCEDESRCAE